MSVGFPIHDEAMGVTQSATQGTHHHADADYLKIKEGAGVYGTPGKTYTNSVADICILCQACDAYGAPYSCTALNGERFQLQGFLRH